MFKEVTLEVSLKPFKQTDDDYIRNICKNVFAQWMPLIKDAETVSIMLWAADGSEILEYTGNLSEEFEWAKYIGTANNPLNPTDDDGICPHKYKYLYIDNPPTMTYGILKKITELFKEEGKKALPYTKILVGDTFDIGPEFSVSDFKYKRHAEICSGEQLDRFGFIDCTATLKGDSKPYAAYKSGIPEGTPFGTFLGKQATIFLRNMGMDFLWLSNGFGFSADPWSLKGKVFDGENFHSEKLTDTRNKVFDFWKLFRTACPNYPIRVRGTNNTVGIDYATDAVPIYDIFNGGFNIDAIPNSPWAALNNNYGLEIMGHLTRVCELPCNDFLFRYYIHDPWWQNSPWYDRYEGQPNDIYLPLAVTRITEDGKIQSANKLNILSIDNSFGNMPDSCVYEPLPHILKAKKDAGDKPAPLVLLYPMREYSTSTNETAIKQMYYGDKYIVEAINNSLPLNCVVSTDNFLKNDLSIYSESVLISPVPETEEIKQKLYKFISNGGRVIFYGTEEYLSKINDIDTVKINVENSKPTLIREKLADFGFYINFDKLQSDKKTTTMTIANSNNGFFFSLYNQSTLLDMYLKFPLGVPIFIGYDTLIENGVGKYRFGKSEHLECRVFVEQKDGIVSMNETYPANRKYRRIMTLTGLKNATVYFFPEEYCKFNAYVGPDADWYRMAPPFYDNFKICEDKVHGTYLKGENISGGLKFYMPFPEYLK